MNRGQGAALRTGYRLALVTGAEVVVTMDADGQHQPSELSRLVAPIVAGEADVVNGSRVLGDADPSHAARELGIKLFARLLSLLTWSRVTDPACGSRAVRTGALRRVAGPFHRCGWARAVRWEAAPCSRPAPSSESAASWVTSRPSASA